MNRQTKKLFILIGGWLAGATAALAQPEVTTVVTGFAAGSHFFIAVIGGVILAMGFQLLLTSLSVASGISMVGNLEEKGSSSKKKSSAKNRPQPSQSSDDDSSTLTKISSGIGIWTVITASISLFFASLLAVRLSLVGNLWMGITLGLIIWAAFFSTMAYLEVKSVSTLIGGIFSTALRGLRTSFSALKSAFEASPADKVAKITDETITHIREELSQAFSESHIADKLDEYIEQLQPKELDLNQVRKELKALMKDLRLEETLEVDEEGELKRFVTLAEKNPRLSKQDVQRLGDTYKEVRESVRSAGTGSEKAAVLADKLSPGSEEDTRRTREKLENYLRSTGREEINPEQIKHDIDEIFHDPKATPQILRNRLNQIDRETVVALLSQRDDISREKAEKIIGSVEKAIDFVRQKASGGAESAKSGKERAAGMGHGIEERMRGYLDSLQRPEFNYDRIKHDIERIFHDPKATPEILRSRWQMYDRESLITLLSSRENLSREDAERIVGKVEEARDNMIRKAERLEAEVRSRLESAKQTALHEAENLRKASASAAWWMVGTAVISAAFSGLGAVIAIGGW